MTNYVYRNVVSGAVYSSPEDAIKSSSAGDIEALEAFYPELPKSDKYTFAYCIKCGHVSKSGFIYGYSSDYLFAKYGQDHKIEEVVTVPTEGFEELWENTELHFNPRGLTKQEFLNKVSSVSR